MESHRYRRTVVLGGEVALAVALCPVSYAVFVKLLVVIFPSSTGLGELLRAGGGKNANASVAGSLTGTGMAADLEEAPAVLQVLNPKVTHKRGDEITWVNARSGIPLHGRDGVQTARKGAARIDFDEHNHLNLSENTLIIIRETLRDVDRPERMATVMMMEGDLWADVTSDPDGRGMAFQVQTPSGAARVTGSSGETPARLRVSVDARRTATFSVQSGEAQVTTRGEVVRFGPNQSVHVDSGGKASAAVALPAAPALIAPAAGALIALGSTASRPTFTWEQVASATGYRFQLARDAGFRHIEVDVTTEGTAHRVNDPREGPYVWRVSAVVHQAEGQPSAPRALRVSKSSDGPRLDIGSPPSVVRSTRLTIQGKTDRAARVLIGNESIDIDDEGRFEHDVTLKRGMNVIVVEAVDASGRSTYRSAIVNAKP